GNRFAGPEISLREFCGDAGRANPRTGAQTKQVSEVTDAKRFAKAVPRPARRHGLDGLPPTHRPNRPAAERTWGGARPSTRRTAGAVFLRPRIHKPLAACLKDVRARRLRGGCGGRSRPGGVGLRPL